MFSTLEIKSIAGTPAEHAKTLRKLAKELENHGHLVTDHKVSSKKSTGEAKILKFEAEVERDPETKHIVIPATSTKPKKIVFWVHLKNADGGIHAKTIEGQADMLELIKTTIRDAKRKKFPVNGETVVHGVTGSGYVSHPKFKKAKKLAKFKDPEIDKLLVPAKTPVAKKAAAL